MIDPQQKVVMKPLIFVIVVVLPMALLQAQQQDSVRFKNYFGFSASRVSGVGLTFGFEPSSKLTAQITGGIFKTNSSSSSSFGIELQYNITNIAGARLFVGPAMGHFSSSDNMTNQKTESWETVYAFAMGAASPLTGFFNDRLRFTISLYYPTFYKDGIGIGAGTSVQFLF
jgi:hypothetical protein